MTADDLLALLDAARDAVMQPYRSNGPQFYPAARDAAAAFDGHMLGALAWHVADGGVDAAAWRAAIETARGAAADDLERHRTQGWVA